MYALRYLLEDSVLRDYQVSTLLNIVENDSGLIAYQTGLGKTYAMIAGLIARFNTNKTKRVLWVAPLNTVSETSLAIARESVLRFQTISGATSDKVYRSSPLDYDITIINYEAFDDEYVIEAVSLWANLGIFDTIVIDEAHLVANFNSSNRVGFIYFLAYRTQYKYFLTATPIIKSIDSYSALIANLTNRLYDLFSIRYEMHKGLYKYEDHPNLISFKDREDEIPFEVEYVQADSLDVDDNPRVFGLEVFKYLRGETATNINNKMLEIISSYNDKHFIVYCHLTINHAFLKRFLIKNGFKVGVISGSNTLTYKRTMIKKYNSRELDVLIYSINEGINLPAEFCIMYDFNIYYQQAGGRGLRQEETGDYRVHLLLSDSTKELNYFKNTVQKNALLVEKALKRGVKLCM